MIKPHPATVSPATGFKEIAQAFIGSRINHLYVVNEHNTFIGAISLHDIKAYLGQPDFAACVIASDILREDFPVIKPTDPLAEALAAFTRHDLERLPVVADSRSRELLGSLSKNDLLLALAQGAAVGQESSPGNPNR
ncbi:MAG: CBS domain-containing protein [Candidatus Didemnitutus sp.]|nr:CBS domain-containing protein [Candidatus Didemnitutus sp.]